MGYAATKLDFDISNTLNDIVFNSDAFLNKVENILSTPLGSMPFYRDFGTNLEKYLFRPLTYSNANLIAIEIENRIKRYYPQARVIVDMKDIDFSTREYPVSITISHPKISEPVQLEKRFQKYV